MATEQTRSTSRPTPLAESLEQGILHLRLARPEKRNALNRETVDLLRQRVVSASAEQIDAIVIEGEGPVFCAGADLAYLEELASFSIEENVEDSRALADALLALYETPIPVIARVHGHAIAGGCGLANVCDIVVAVEGAKFGYTEVGIGFIPAIVTAILLQKSPQMFTRELLLTGRLVSAEEAHRRGLVTTVVADEEALDEEIGAICRRLSTVDRGAVRLTKEMMNRMGGMTFEAAVDYGVRMNAAARMRQECRDGIARFLARSRRSE